MIIINDDDINNMTLEHDKNTCSSGNEVVLPSSTTNDAEMLQVNATTIAKQAISSDITLEECSITYFTGYLAKSTLTKHKCQECQKNLVKELNLEDQKQLLILNKSYSFNKNIK